MAKRNGENLTLKERLLRTGAIAAMAAVALSGCESSKNVEATPTATAITQEVTSTDPTPVVTETPTVTATPETTPSAETTQNAEFQARLDELKRMSYADYLGATDEQERVTYALNVYGDEIAETARFYSIASGNNIDALPETISPDNTAVEAETVNLNILRTALIIAAHEGFDEGMKVLASGFTDPERMPSVFVEYVRAYADLDPVKAELVNGMSLYDNQIALRYVDGEPERTYRKIAVGDEQCWTSDVDGQYNITLCPAQYETADGELHDYWVRDY